LHPNTKLLVIPDVVHGFDKFVKEDDTNMMEKKTDSYAAAVTFVNRG
jgi:hypothetical protein